MSSSRFSVILAVSLFAVAGTPGFAASLSEPLVDTGLTVVTPRPDADLVVVRERFYSTPGVDLTSFGIGTGNDEFVQSIYFRFFTQSTSGAEDSLLGAVTFPPGTTILGFIYQPSLLGADAPGPYTQSDALFAVAANPADYSPSSRGFEPPGTGIGSSEYICQMDERSFLFGLDVTGGMDDFRVIVDYGNSFPPALTFQVDLYEEVLGGATAVRGLRLGNPSGSTVPGEGDHGEVTHLVQIPLTQDDPPVASSTPPTSGGHVIYLSRETNGRPRIDGFDLRAGAWMPAIAQMPTAFGNTSRAIAVGSLDGLLYMVGGETGLASVDPTTGSVSNIGMPDNTGHVIRAAAVSGNSRVFVLRETSFPSPEDAWVDAYDTSSGVFTTDFAVFGTNNMPHPVDIIAGTDGQLYVLGFINGFHKVDPVTGAITLDAAILPDTPGNNVRGVADPQSNLVYILRDTGTASTGDSFVDTVDTMTGAFTQNVFTVSGTFVPDPAGIMVDNARNLWVFGKNGGAVGFDLTSPSSPPFYETRCLDFAGFTTHAAIPRVPREVSPPLSGFPLKTDYAATPFNLRVTWEDLGIPGVLYNLYEGTIGSYYSHASMSCRIAGTSDGAGSLYQEFLSMPVGDSRYYLVTASDSSGEGSAGRSSLGTGRPQAAAGSACGPTP